VEAGAAVGVASWEKTLMCNKPWKEGAMDDTYDDRRIFGRRKMTRRTYDLLHGKATEEERLQYDMLLLSINQALDRRLQERRSGADRRLLIDPPGVSNE